MILFFCATPVQIYQVVNIKTQYYSDKDCVLYILDYFADAEKYVDKCKEIGIFQNVVFVKSWKIFQRTASHKYKDVKVFSGVQQKFFSILGKCAPLRMLYGRLWRIFYYIFKNDALKILQLEKGTEIEEVFFSYFDPLMVMLYLKTKGENTEFNRFEDGTLTYASGVDFLMMRIEKLLKVPERLFKPQKIYAHIPEAIKDIEKSDTQIIKLDFSKNEDAREKLYKVFDIDKIPEIKEKVVFFDTLYDAQDMDAMIEPLIDRFKDDLVFKKHPRRPDKYYENRGLNVYKGESLPFEMYCEFFDVSDKILVSYASTTCFVPALFFAKPTKSILCYKFAAKETADDLSSFDEFYKRLRECNVPIQLEMPESKAAYQDLILK